MSGTKRSYISLIVGLAALLGAAWAAPAEVMEMPLSLDFDAGEPVGAWYWEDIGNEMSTGDLQVDGGSDGWAVNDAGRGDDGDYYDDFHGIAVDGTLFSSPGNMGDRTDTTAGTFIRSQTAPMSGLNVDMEYFFSADAPVIRAMAHFENTGSSAITATVRYGGDLGSDSSTTHEASASGDTVLDAADQWIVTSEGGTAEFNAFVLFGPEGGSTTPSSLLVDGDTIMVDYELTVGAGQSVSLMWFGYLASSTSDAVSFMQSNFSSNSQLANSGLLAGLTQADVDRVANYSGATLVPEPMTLSTLALGSLVALRKRARR